MTFIEFIGFLIAMGILLFSAMRRVREERRRRADPQRYAEEESHRQEKAEVAYRDLLQSLNLEVEEPEEAPRPVPKVAPPPPPEEETPAAPIHETHRRLSDEFEYHSQIEDRKRINPIQHRRIGTRIEAKFGEGYGKRLVDEELRGTGPVMSAIKGRPPRIRTIINALPTKRLLVISKEIIGPPRALQEIGSDRPAEL